ncbi:hypothetical protein [Hymenobacter cavernae]|uniref:Cytochrome c domain-containing protein n=1 Tax=Hymenobacter cavernae TaxID=2044852 RepID=A0ABQ1TIM5_9BACT|nr:hypothetical protein [Hymenobacter cavernae]GGE96493.1 hypothetical protein GCM10011383_04090 [Hymenobacter cavernae]
MRLRFSLVLLLSLGWLSNCTYDNAEDHAPDPDPEPTPTCDVSSVTYTATISPILANCRGCHNASAPAANVNLVDYTQVKRHADSGRLMGAITHATGYKPMPLNGAKLGDCEIARIQKWIDAGAPNN